MEEKSRMSIAPDATTGDRRFARALIASAMVHAVAFHLLGDLRPRPPADEESMPLEVRLLRPPPVEDSFASAAPRIQAQPVQSPPLPRTAMLKAPRADVPRPRPERVLRARTGESITAPTSPAAAAPAAETVSPAAPAEPAIPAVAAAPPEPPSHTFEPAPDRLALQARFGRDIEGAVDAAKSYPRIARERGWQGTVKLRFRFLPGGNLDDVGVVLSSGIPLLDEHALRMARAAELPRLPGALSAAAFELDVPIHFRLRS
jgi:protein TonB